MGSRIRRNVHVLMLAVLIGWGFAHTLEAATIEEIQQQIEATKQQAEQYEKEIGAIQNQLTLIGQEKQTLEQTVQQLDVSRRKLSTDINLTETQIDTASLTISELAYEIAVHEEQAERNAKAISEAIRSMNQTESESFIEILLTREELSDVWNDVETLQRFQSVLRKEIGELNQLKEELRQRQGESELTRQELLDLKTKLADQKYGVDVNRNEKNKLLTQTQSQESAYQQQLQEKIAARNQFMEQLQDLESQLQIAVDPTKFPEAGDNVLAWPLDDVRITQYFGNTSFAAGAGYAVYNGNGHNGIDFGVPVGARVKAALAGTVTATGNTDAACPGASYGKWVLLKHANGLSTLYAHLSEISVSSGAALATGETLGYSGNTGYATGPHLHFTVYATEGMQVQTFPSRGCPGAIYTMPVADQSAYLNPMSYLQ